MRFIQYISIAFFTFLIGFFIYQNTPHYQIITGEIFGTFYKIKIKTDSKNNILKNKIKRKLDDVDMTMSVFKKDSEISELNRLPLNKKMPLSKGMRTVLRAAHRVWKQSQGAFDPTLGTVIDLWGFGPEEIQKEPSDKELKKAMSSVGFDKLVFYEDYHKVKKTIKNTALNLSAIAKGYAVDEIAILLDKEGYENYVVEIGGEVKTKGFRSSKQEPWTIGVSRPTRRSTDTITVLSLSNIAVATSGNYRNYYEHNGKTFTHIISALTGKPILNDILSVSVFHDSCMYADAYATAIMSMSLKDAVKFADKYMIKALIYDNNYQAHVSKAAKDVF